MSAFCVQRRIRFADCDPGGIVYYPRYLVMLNILMEDWFTGPLGVSWQDLMSVRGIGLPTVRLEADFKAISRIADEVLLSLSVERLGGRSFTLNLACHGHEDSELRMRLRQVVVFTSLADYRSIPIPDDIRAAMERTMNSEGDLA